MVSTLKVEGMSCSHCENAVKKALSAIDGISDVSVNLAEKTVAVTHTDNVPIETLKTEIEEQGYDVVS